MKNYVQEGRYLTALAVTPAMVSGEGRVIGGVFGVAVADIANNGDGVLDTEGVYEFDKPNPDSGCTLFASAYWDATNKKVTSVSTGNTLIGVFSEAATNTAVKARVLLGGGVSGKDEFTVSYNRAGAGALPAAVTIFVAPVPVRVLGVSAVFGTPNTAAQTADITKDVGTNAPGAGTAVMLGATKIDLAATANTVQSPALTSTAADLVLAAGNRLAFKPSITGTQIADLAVTIHLARA